MPPTPLSAEREHARSLDAADPLRRFREEFHVPRGPRGEPAVYLCGNSLGLQPRSARAAVLRELDDWAELGVAAHFEGHTPWYSYHEVFREPAARLVGARPGEVVVMNGLTVNLHLMMVSFYRPTPQRYKILMEGPAFPSDTYAVQTQIAFHGYDPADALVIVEPPAGRHCLEPADFEAVLEREGERVALVLLGGVNFFTGQLLDLPGLTAAAQRRGCTVGLDLAHAAGNVPLALHDWNVDFAVWCSYKYLNGGPGALAGCFVHERHAQAGLPRFGGWWGNDPQTRFRMHLERQFIPVAGADGWQLSNPPILAAAALRESLALFDQAGMAALRRKSVQLTGYLAGLLGGIGGLPFEIITPADPEQRGCQLSLLVHDRPREYYQALESAGIVCDFRPPNVIRAAPVPLYNSFEDAWRFAGAVAQGVA